MGAVLKEACLPALRAEVEALSDVRDSQVVLGFKRESGVSRWLTDDEISDGVLEAIRKREAQHSVGTLETLGPKAAMTFPTTVLATSKS